MGKNKNVAKGSVGRTLIKGKRVNRRGGSDNEQWLHTSDLPDGYDWGRLNLKSVTEQTAIDDFLATAELANTEFVAEKENITIVTSNNIPGVFTDEELKEIKNAQSSNQKFVTVPRRPLWTKDTSPEELQMTEKEAFLNWRRQLALLQESDSKLLLTPYEKNIDVWRQLWRVIERSDVICQIVDARNPLLYRCEDLEKYILEINDQKKTMLLINKSDLLSESQRSYWADYFTAKNVQIIFWSALIESEIKEGTVEDYSEISIQKDTDEEDESEDFASNTQLDLIAQKTEEITVKDVMNSTLEEVTNELIDNSDLQGNFKCGHKSQAEESYGAKFMDKNETCPSNADSTGRDLVTEVERAGLAQAVESISTINNTARLYSREELCTLFGAFKKVLEGEDRNYVTIGLVGYPNVGKSSTINALLQTKKTSVSATPGKTKHFQTLFVNDGLCLCDCPGLVFPQFVTSKAEMILGGILPIDEMRDCIPPVTLLCQYIPRRVLEDMYGININAPKEGDDPTQYAAAEELLSSYASMRGFMTSHGLPDISRAARYILKDFVKGRMLYCTPPPGVGTKDFIPVTLPGTSKRRTHLNSTRVTHTAAKQVDYDFFEQGKTSAIFKVPTGFRRTGENLPQEHTGISKPWKKHFNKNKKEKLRRICKS